MGTILTNWKTSLLGLVVGGLYVAANQYTAGMTWKQWGLAVAIAVWGFVQKDLNVTGGTVGATPAAAVRATQESPK